MVEELYIKKVLNGDTDAFKFFVTHYKDIAFSVAVSIVKDEFTASDVVQEAFVKAFENLKSFKGKSKFSTWFIRIVINESYKVVQRNKVQFTDTVPELEENMHDGFKEHDQKYYVNEVLRILPANESLVLRLFYLNENSVKEIQEMTGWNESKVKVTLHRGRKSMESKLMKMLNQEVKSLI